MARSGLFAALEPARMGGGRRTKSRRTRRTRKTRRTRRSRSRRSRG